MHDGGAVIGCIEGVATRTQVKLGDSSGGVMFSILTFMKEFLKEKNI